jgi:hypothetical protein
MARARTLRRRPKSQTRRPIPAEGLAITAFRTLMHDVMNIYLTVTPFPALEPRHPGVDPAHLRILVRAAEVVFLEVVRYYSHPRHRREAE